MEVKMSKRGWAILAGAVTAAVVLVVALVIGVSTLSAQGTEPTPTPVPQGPGGWGGGRFWGNCPCGLTAAEAGRWGYRAYGQAEIVAEQLGMTVDDLTAALREGRSVADLATEKGVALDTIVEALMAPRRDALAQAVANGRLTQEQADSMLAEMQENIIEHLNQPGLPMGGGPAGQMMRAERMGWQLHGQLDLVAQALGMAPEDLTAELQGGKSVAQVAEEKGVALDTIVEALLAPRREAMAQAVADGELTQAEADARLVQMRENITARLQQTWEQRGIFGLGRGMMRGGMGGGRMGGRGGWWGTTQP
jgi:lambda repressor-like predicted transcriptional regulator